ncbi:MAG: tRNA pseudouridine(38-40) synthase TruA [Acidiferrobacteraceae bacterium]|nr:tRNA pseudouridine(38-40) synthase TruA [Acidiferrobacteraceae bacterium]
MSRYALTIEYDGSKFNGWQSQIGVPTVQDALETALSSVANHSVRVLGAGRTDTGVHASGQVAHFDSASERSLNSWLRGANTELPDAISVLAVSQVNNQFHARFSATGRSYRYVILNRPIAPTFFRRRVTWEYRSLNIQEMALAARCLVGKHDFSAYRAAGCQSHSAVRNLRKLTVESEGAWIWIDVEADSFLQHMVRNIVGALLKVGAQEKDIRWPEEVLHSRDRQCGGPTAPPDGLYFTQASYPSEYRLPTIPVCRFW